ncbi:MAG: hypothetical protein QXU54_00475 [Candidatus Micrarchaeia archaeon]
MPAPHALVCGLLEDGGRVLFLVERTADGSERLSLPGRVITRGENPSLAVKQCFESQAGLDVQVLEVMIQGRHNAGSRKNKVWVPALGVRVSAKNRFASPRPPFTGVRWVDMKMALGKVRLSRTAEWLLRKNVH